MKDYIELRQKIEKGEKPKYHGLSLKVLTGKSFLNKIHIYNEKCGGGLRLFKIPSETSKINNRIKPRTEAYKKRRLKRKFRTQVKHQLIGNQIL